MPRQLSACALDTNTNTPVTPHSTTSLSKPNYNSTSTSWNHSQPTYKPAASECKNKENNPSDAALTRETQREGFNDCLRIKHIHFSSANRQSLLGNTTRLAKNPHHTNDASSTLPT
mmetsp:Transcript_8169/g.15628  ORF Transcript_8169/g.15628 Transcript_8169/m.15628 type:complete len:116 (+) Transcript_8169:3-350(+)